MEVLFQIRKSHKEGSDRQRLRTQWLRRSYAPAASETIKGNTLPRVKRFSHRIGLWRFTEGRRLGRSRVFHLLFSATYILQAHVTVTGNPLALRVHYWRCSQHHHLARRRLPSVNRSWRRQSPACKMMMLRASSSCTQETAFCQPELE